MGAKYSFLAVAGLTLLSAALFFMASLSPAEVVEAVPVLETCPPETAATEQREPDPRQERCREVGEAVSAGCAFVYDTGSRDMLWCSGDPTSQLYPASITKLFTAYAALDILEPDRVITAGKELGLLQSGSSTAFIAYGSRLTAEQLVEAMLLPSGNDAAYILAAAAGKVLLDNEKASPREAVDAFLEEMNRRGRELGLANSHFATPDGYHSQDHYSCPSDLATIGELALEHPVIAGYAATQQDSAIFKSGETVTWYNTNRLLNPESAWYCADAVGLKTGYTQEAGYCLLAAFRAGEDHILVGILDAENKLSRYSDAVALFRAAAPEPTP